MSLLCRSLHIPAAKPSGEARVNVLKEQVLLLSLDQDSETVTIAVVVCGSCRPESRTVSIGNVLPSAQVMDVGCI